MDNLFQALANAADGAFVINEDQYIIYWNEAAQELLGYTAPEVVGRACYEILRSCDDKGQSFCRRHCQVSTTALAGRPVATCNVAAQTKSGEIRWISVSILTMFTAGKNTTPIIVHLFRDATQKKQNEQFVRQLFDSTKSPPEVTTSATPVSPAGPPTDLLTEREHEVLALLVQGFSTPDIALTLSISSATVRNHIQSILNKLQVHSRLEAVAYAYEHGLVTRD